MAAAAGNMDHIEHLPSVIIVFGEAFVPSRRTKGCGADRRISTAFPLQVVIKKGAGIPARSPISCSYYKRKSQFGGVPISADRDPVPQENSPRNQRLAVDF
jgi:hypothetical protein